MAALALAQHWLNDSRTPVLLYCICQEPSQSSAGGTHYRTASFVAISVRCLHNLRVVGASNVSQTDMTRDSGLTNITYKLRSSTS